MRIGVLCVTFNRQAMLRELLANFAAQEAHLAAVLVVDNKSTDGTADLLAAWKADTSAGTRRELLSLPSNTGGAGGFHAGLEWYARHAADFDFVYIADDDAFPAPDLFSTFPELAKDIPGDPVAICSAVHTRDGIDWNHRRDTIRNWSGRLSVVRVPVERYTSPFRFNTYSFVGVFLRPRVLEAGVFPDKEFFIGCDDSDHSLRTSRLGEIWCHPSMVVRHDHEVESGSKPDVVGWKNYYARRNYLIMARTNYGWFTFVREWINSLRGQWHIFKDSLREGPRVRAYLPVYWAAMVDALRDRKGLHPVYRPGWKAKA